MFSSFKKGIILVLFLLVFGIFVHAQTTDSSDHNLPVDDIYNYIEDQKLSSSMYTNKDDMRPLADESYIEIEQDDRLIASNDRFELYLNEQNLNFKVKNTATSYVWQTLIPDPQEAGGLTSFFSSTIGFEYIARRAQRMDLIPNRGLEQTDYSVDISDIHDGVQLDLFVERIGNVVLDLSFTLEVTLEEKGIKAHIPYDSIHESETEETALASIILFPALGATYVDDVPGYMIIPDGIGSMIRYTDKEGKYSAPFSDRFYDSDFGIPRRTITNNVTSYPLSMPIFGAVHGVDQNAYLAVIDSGDSYARLVAYPNGASNQPYNLIFTKFDYRAVYGQSITSDGQSRVDRVAKTMAEDMTKYYYFLDDEDANYTGMGRQYREYLLENGILQDALEPQDDIPVHLQYLMSDSRNRFIGTGIVEMSTVEQVKQMYDALMSQGITNQTISLQGWNDGGYSGHLPSRLSFETSLGSRSQYKDLIDHINADNPLYLINNYVRATEATSRVSYRNDVAQGVDRFKLERSCSSCVYNRHYTLYPETSKRLSLRHFEAFEEAGVNILFEQLGSALFSYYYDDMYMRSDTLEYYEEIYAHYENHAGFMYPNAYAYAYTNRFFQTPLYNSQLNYYDDLVPLLPIVLNGHMELYSHFLNYNARGREQILMLVDFGINPAYILTHNPSSDLRNTDIERYFSTHFEKWEDSIIEEYTYINDALKHVRGATIEDRRVIDDGLVSTTYSNDVTIIINYSAKEAQVDDIIIPPLDYHVKGAES